MDLDNNPNQDEVNKMEAAASINKTYKGTRSLA